MNRKGFTLVELIAVIALLAIIAIISFVSINSVIEKSKVSDCESLVMNIKTAAKEYASDNRYFWTSDSKKNINAKTLIDGNYLSSQIDENGNVVLDNPFTDDYILAKDVSIDIVLNDDYTVKMIEIKAPEILITCKDE